MSFRKDRLIAAIGIAALLWWLQGCAQEIPEQADPIIGGQHSNMTFSGYVRSGVMFSGH